MKRWLTSRHADVAYQHTNAALRESLPELEEAVVRAYEYAEPEAPGPHTLYDEALNPYVNKLLDANVETDEALKRVFAFVERLSSSTDKNVRDVVIATILPNLIGEPRLTLARRYMGPATRRLLRKAQQ
ncbi:MAG: hypothetical protein K2Y23_25760 [Cyanobacteria bacterium]|nr:hypothetical protein [Cyanobacteriota bacterium]